MTKNLTQGNPLKLILQFSIPLLLGNLFQQTYNMVDAAIVGRVLGTESLAAVGASSSVQFLVLGFCMGICAGFAIPVAQRFGASDFDNLKQYIFTGSVLTAILGITVTTLCALLCPVILHLMATPQNIFNQAYGYLFIIFLGIPFSLLYNLLSGYLRAVGDSRTPFIFLVISALLNIFFDLLFIIVFRWSVQGAALATILSQAISGFLCLILIIRKFEVLHIRKQDRKLTGEKIKVTLMMGIPMGLQYSITAIGTMVMQAANNSLGSIYVSAFAAGSKIKQLSMCPFDALATAVSTFASQNYGAGKIDRIKKGLWQGVAIGALYGALIGLVIIIYGRTMSMLFVKSADKAVEEAVLNASGKYTRCIGFFSWSLGFLNVLRMTTQGLGFSNRAIYSGVVEMIARCIVSFAFVPFFGFNAICFADQTAWVSATLYITPTCLLCVRKIQKELSESKKISESF